MLAFVNRFLGLIDLHSSMERLKEAAQMSMTV